MNRYRKSEEMLERALRSIPLGSQTFSKSYTQYPRGVSPYFIERGKGSRVWDIDGNEYVDFVNGLASITLGYRDPDVDAAVAEQLQSGVIFTLPHPLEVQVAEKIIEMVPCAEQVRFGKNGSDATSGAIRIARACTGRDRVAVCGYHGWQDWYIGSTARNRGVPKVVQDLTHTFPYNDLPALHSLLNTYPGEFAAVILEPMNVAEPGPGFLAELRELTHKHGALLVFDETITGFRLSNGGAQELFGVVPDLATFGKGLANGYPVSAIAGAAKYMNWMEEIFFSFTFGGETLSLAAALATLTKLQRKPVLQTIQRTGQDVMRILQSHIDDLEIKDFIKVSGHPSWSFLLLSDAPGCTVWELKTLLLQELFARGVLSLGSHNISYAHDHEDLRILNAAYGGALGVIKQAISRGSTQGLLKAKPLEPLFRIR